MMRDRVSWSWWRWSLVLAGITGVSAAASAHGTPTTAVFGVTVSFSVVLGASATIGSLGGVAAVALRSWGAQRWVGDSRFVGAVGFALVSLAVLLAYPGLRARPLISVGGILVGGVVALALSESIDSRSKVPEANAAFGVLAIHHVLEGAALAATYAAGSRIGLAAAGVLTLHTIAETAVVGGVYTAANRVRRGFIAVVVMQIGYVGAAIGALAMAVSVTSVTSLVPAIASGVLLYVGVRHASTITPGVPDCH